MLSRTSSLNPGISFYDSGASVYGMDLGYSGSNYRTRIFAPNTQHIAISFATTTPTQQSHFTDAVIVKGSTGDVGLGMVPSYRLDVTGAARISTGFGCNGKTPQTAYASGGAAGGTATSGGYGFVSAAEMNAFVTLLTNVRLALVANGVMS